MLSPTSVTKSERSMKCCYMPSMNECPQLNEFIIFSVHAMSPSHGIYLGRRSGWDAGGMQANELCMQRTHWRRKCEEATTQGTDDCDGNPDRTIGRGMQQPGRAVLPEEERSTMGPLLTPVKDSHFPSSRPLLAAVDMHTKY